MKASTPPLLLQVLTILFSTSVYWKAFPSPQKVGCINRSAQSNLQKWSWFCPWSWSAPDRGLICGQPTALLQQPAEWGDSACLYTKASQKAEIRTTLLQLLPLLTAELSPHPSRVPIQKQNAWIQVSLWTIFLAPPQSFLSSSVSRILSLCSHGKLLSSLSKSLLLHVVVLHPESSTRLRLSHKRAERIEAGARRSHLHFSHISEVTCQTKKGLKANSSDSLNKKVEKQFPEAEILFIFSIQKILMPSGYADKEKQRVQRLCSYGIIAAIVSFEQATITFESERQVSISYKPWLYPKPFYSEENQLHNSAGFWEIRI